MSLADLRDIEFTSPRTLDEACAAMARYHRDGYQVWALSGCTDWMVERHLDPIAEQPRRAAAVDMQGLSELRGILVDAGRAWIGAAETFLSIRRHPELATRCALLAEMAADVGAIQIQARGTLGGNLVSGSPAADGVTALFALDAAVVLQSIRGRRTVPVTSYYTGYRRSVREPDELVVGFELDLPSPGAMTLWRKVGTRKAQSISKVALAAVAQRGADGRLDRLGFGMASVAEVVLPLHAVRSLALGVRPRDIDLGAVERAVDQDIRPIDDIRSTARYRRHVARTLVRRFFESIDPG
jgi:xanthine dehydrogenase small subunit